MIGYMFSVPLDGYSILTTEKVVQELVDVKHCHVCRVSDWSTTIGVMCHVSPIALFHFHGKLMEIIGVMCHVSDKSTTIVVTALVAATSSAMN